MGLVPKLNFNNATLPHERELLEIVEMAYKAYEDKDYVGVFVSDTHTQVQYLLTLLYNATEWDVGNVKIFREGIEVVDGGKVIGMALSDPSRLRGMSVSEVVIFGNIGEFFHCANTSLAQASGEMRFVA